MMKKEVIMEFYVIISIQGQSNCIHCIISRRIEVSSCGSKPAKSDEMFANGIQIYSFIIRLPLRG